jgi:hypothetical protein
MKTFTKIINPGTVKVARTSYELYIKIAYNLNGCLTLSGVVGPNSLGGCAGSAGQCDEELVRIDGFHRYWSHKRAEKLRRVWRAWHLNHNRPGCTHQKDWDVNKVLFLPDGEKRLAGLTMYDEHPEGLLCKPCPVCGYKYGTAWNKEAVPENVLVWLHGLPDTEYNPAWV